MLRLPALILSLVLLVARPGQVPDARTAAPDTVQAGDVALDASRLTAFSIVRRLTLTRGDSAAPFGTQSESLSLGALDGRPVWLDILVFDTPRAITVDSSWIDARTMEPIRMRSTNRERDMKLEFAGRRVRGRITPATGDPTLLEHELPARPFEWNMFGLAISTLPLEAGYRAVMPVYGDGYDAINWYTVEVVGDTFLTRSTGFQAPMWEVLATPHTAGPTARLWVSRRHNLVDRALLTEPGIAVLYAREEARR